MKSIVFVVFLGGTIPLAAEPTTHPVMKEFFSYSRKSQDSFITTSVIMLGVIAAQTEPKIATCLNKWYRGSRAAKNKRNSEIIDAMKKHPQYIPTTIVLAVVERECGKFKRAPK